MLAARQSLGPVHGSWIMKESGGKSGKYQKRYLEMIATSTGSINLEYRKTRDGKPCGTISLAETKRAERTGSASSTEDANDESGAPGFSLETENRTYRFQCLQGCDPDETRSPVDVREEWMQQLSRATMLKELSGKIGVSGAVVRDAVVHSSSEYKNDVIEENALTEKSGVLEKRGGFEGQKGWKTRLFVLDPREMELRYYKGKRAVPSALKGSVTLKFGAAIRREDDANTKTMIVVDSENNRKFMVRAKTPEEAAEWKVAIDEVVQLSKPKKLVTAKQASSRPKPARRIKRKPKSDADVGARSEG